jgi:uncharacterized protein YjbJ (UPF0337 family)
MNKDKAEGKAKEIVGRAQRAGGRLTGNNKARIKGGMRQAEGKLQQGVGGVKDAAKDVSKAARKSSKPDGSTRITRTTRTKTTTTRERPD